MIKLDDFFPNGFESWYETFYEIVAHFEFILNCDYGEDYRGLKEVINAVGKGGLWEKAKTLTDRFELQYQDKEWDGEWFDVLHEFLEKELHD